MEILIGMIEFNYFSVPNREAATCKSWNEYMHIFITYESTYKSSGKYFQESTELNEN